MIVMGVGEKKTLVDNDRRNIYRIYLFPYIPFVYCNYGTYIFP